MCARRSVNSSLCEKAPENSWFLLTVIGSLHQKTALPIKIHQAPPSLPPSVNAHALVQLLLLLSHISHAVQLLASAAVSECLNRHVSRFSPNRECVASA